MNEEQKHIESCRAEDPLAQTMEACGNESDLQAALQPLLVETMPGYEPVPTTAPTSPIAELPGVLISIIRRVATKPLTMFGERPAKQSLLGTLLDTWNAIRQRLAGNPSAGIPDRRADMSAHSLPTALALLNDRKITNGFSTTDGIPDGMSLARLLCDTSAASSVTEIVDDNYGYTMTRNQLGLFPNATKITLGCKVLEQIQISTSAELVMDELDTVNRTGTWLAAFNYDGDRLSFPNLKTINGYQGSTGVFAQGNYKELLIPKVTRIHDNPGYHGCFLGAYQGRDSHNLRRLVVGRLTDFSWNFGGYYNTSLVSPCLDFIHFEIGDGTAISLDFSKWSPTNALDASSTDLIEEGSEAENNLQQFLLNFREFIALRLANRKDTTALDLTLSAAVYNAVTGADSGWASLHTLADLGITTDDLTELEQELGITTATLYSTWLDTYTGANGIHWNVNKAN